MPVHRLQLAHQVDQPRHQWQLIAHLLEDIGIGAFQRADALAQAGGKIQFTPHRTFGDFRHLLTDACQFGDLVDAFNFYRRRVHIHHQQPRGTQMRNFAERSHIQPALRRQQLGACRQGASQTHHLIVLDAPGGNNHHRRTQLALEIGNARFVQFSAI
ncbi:hypothetical protein D3C78_1096270 [compost metagenome]